MNVHARVLSLALTAIFAFSHIENTHAQNKIFTIVIDPGHGGNDPGAVSGKLLEKELNLAVAKKFGELISDGMPDVKVIYTRTGDTYPGLAERGAMANKANADLFFSIHTNAHENSAANGTSTYIMGMSKNNENLAEAMRENEVIKYEDDYSETYDGFDPMSAESYIMFNLMQYAHFDRSLQLARIVQKHYTKNTSMRDRGAAQGPYLVLWKTAMPSVLTEIGFISNEADRKYIFSTAGQTAVAHALYDAFREYKTAVTTHHQAAAKTAAAQITTPSVAETAAAPSRERNQATSTATPVITSTKEENNYQLPPSQDASASLTADGRHSAGEPRISDARLSISNFQFYVQLAASRTKIAPNDAQWGEYRGKVVERVIDGWYKYSLGPFETKAEAAAKQGEVRKTKFKDAFITK